MDCDSLCATSHNSTEKQTAEVSMIKTQLTFYLMVQQKYRTKEAGTITEMVILAKIRTIQNGPLGSKLKHFNIR